MLLIREIMYCKPGKVRAMVDKSLAMAPRTRTRSSSNARRRSPTIWWTTADVRSTKSKGRTERE
jgi:hypothetical protein